MEFGFVGLCSRFLSCHGCHESVEFCAVGVELLISWNVGPATYAGNVEFGVVFSGWGPAVNDFFGRGASMLANVVKQKDDGSTIAVVGMLEAAEALDIRRGFRQSEPMVARHVANVERIAIALAQIGLTLGQRQSLVMVFQIKIGHHTFNNII